ncbi:hypothetical protein [Streptomyces sp. NPDC002343]|jgi:hypothetical protein
MKKAARTLLIGTSLAFATAVLGAAGTGIDWPGPVHDTVTATASGATSAAGAAGTAGSVVRQGGGDIDWP